MDPALQAELMTLRGRLNDRLLELRAEIRAAQRDRLESGSAVGHEVADFKDEAAQQQFEDLDGVQEQRDIDELGQVESALQRLHDGTYGDCTDCAEPILLQRLRVQPAAQRCATCQVAHERAQARAR
jgi:DnaK suppressor protein